MIESINNLYKYRQLLKSNVRKEIRGKYKGSFLGVLWSFVSPLLMTLVYAIVFPFLLRNGQEHYTTYIVIGILPWIWCTTSISQGTPTILHNGGIVKKVFFPREILPISVVTSGLVNFLISCIIILIFLLFSGIGYSFNILFLPLILIVQYMFLLGVVLITSALNVYVRDVEYIVTFIMQMVFYATPILYPTTMFPEAIRGIIRLNPMVTILESYRNIFFYKQTPDLLALLLVGIGSFIILLIGFKIFHKLERGFAEEL